MITWLAYLWDALRERLWFLPTVFSVAGLITGWLMLLVDRVIADLGWQLPAWLVTTGESARIVLGAIISGLVTVAGLAFSLTMLSISQTTSQYGPRLLRPILDSTIIQNVLGIFLGTIIFSMLVLRAIKEDPSGQLFTPEFSILAAEVAAVGCVFSLLVLTNHMTRSLRAETLVMDVHCDLNRSVDKFLRETDRMQSGNDAGASRFRALIASSQPIYGESSGYVSAIDFEGLAEFARSAEKVIDLCCQPGDFCYDNSVLARCSNQNGSKLSSEELKRVVAKVHDSVLLGATRSTRQDVEAAILDLVEIAVRALSPGVNDPVTAINVVDYLTSSMTRLADCQWPTEIYQVREDGSGLRFQRVTFEGMLDSAMNQIRQNAGNSVAVYCRLLEGLGAIGKATHDQQRLAWVSRHRDMVIRQAEDSVREDHDLEDIRQRARFID